MEWNDQFLKIFREAVDRYHTTLRAQPASLFEAAETEFLESIGYSAEEMYAYIADYAMTGEPTPSTSLLIASVRRAFFLTAQRGIRGNAKPITAADLPSELDEFQEIPYLPRIIRKAEVKLFGTLEPSLMFYNAEDRQFLREHGNIPPADFLNLVWLAHGDKQKVVSAVLNSMRQDAPAENSNDTRSTDTRSSATTGSKPIQSELNFD